MKHIKLLTSTILIVLVILLCIAGPYISGYNAFEQDITIKHQPPNVSHWFGTDSLGRDIFTRVCLGGRNSLIISFLCAIITSLIGCIYGGISANNEKLDKVMMSVLDIFASIPSVLIVIIIPLWFDSKNIHVVILAICVTGWCKMARITRNMLKPLRNADYIFVAKDFKKSNLYIIVRHMLPNIFPIILSRAILSIPEFIFYESFLSYLGIGVQPPDTSWGCLISNAQNNFMFHPYQLLFSGALLILTMLSITILGESIVIKEEITTLNAFSGNCTSNQRKFDTSKSSEKLEILSVENLSVQYANVECEAVHNVNFHINAGEIVGLVGQSGCGKTTIARTLAGIINLFQGEVISDSNIAFCGKKINYNNKESLANLYGIGGVSIIYQDARTHLDPTMRIGEQIKECIRLKKQLSDDELNAYVQSLLTEVGLGDIGTQILSMYPHQLSGGIAQRIVIVMAIAIEPKLLICDEPTASLDAIVKRQIVSVIKKMAEERGVAVLFISHEIDIVKDIATKILVMANGTLQDVVKTSELMKSDNKYTAMLLNAIPTANCVQNDMHTEKTVLRVAHLSYCYPGFENKAIDNISFKLKRGETFGILGESGSGKTTLARIVANHIKDYSGEIILENEINNLQYIFQNAFTAFNPLIKVGNSVLEGCSTLIPQKQNEKLAALFKDVELDISYEKKMPSELSIGQCQRAAIARALAVEPSLVICDEPTSALDTVNQKKVLDLLFNLIHEQKVTCIFISHDVKVVRFMADRIAVMYKGSFVEIAFADELFNNPCHPYTKMLLNHAPLDYNNMDISNTMPKTKSCPYYHICPNRLPICKTNKPELKPLGKNIEVERHHKVACFLFEKEEE